MYARLVVSVPNVGDDVPDAETLVVVTVGVSLFVSTKCTFSTKAYSLSFPVTNAVCLIVPVS